VGRREQIGLSIVVVGAAALVGLVIRAGGGRPQEAAVADGPSAALPGERPPRPLAPPRWAPVLASHAYSAPGMVGAPDYDPIKLGLALGPRVVLSQEPRDAAWAPAMERLMAPLVTKDLGAIPGIGNVSVECRTTGCWVTYTASDERQNFSAAVVLIDLWGGGVSGNRFGEFTTFYRGERFDGIDPADPEALLGRLQERRAGQLAKAQQLHERGWLRYQHVPRDYWPEH
jgi:hypothetical protein